MTHRMARSQGTHANSTGRVAEDMIDAMLRKLGYMPLRQKVIGYGIYGMPIQVDFFIDRVPGFPHGLIIESKWQGAGGSVDEKYPYMVANIRHPGCYPCPVIVLIDGDGARPGAVRWLRGEADGQMLYAVFSLKELVTWCNRNL